MANLPLNTLPYAENAVVDILKLRDYCLNPEHDDGKLGHLQPAKID